jgi:hypothetical protein
VCGQLHAAASLLPEERALTTCWIEGSMYGEVKILEVFTVVTMKNGVFWDVTWCGSLRLLLVTTNVVPSYLILVTLMMEVLSSSEKSVLTRAARL